MGCNRGGGLGIKDLQRIFDHERFGNPNDRLPAGVRYKTPKKQHHEQRTDESNPSFHISVFVRLTDLTILLNVLMDKDRAALKVKSQYFLKKAKKPDQ